MMVKRFRFLISVIVIFQLTWLIFSFGLNGHFHQLDNNRIIFHTHPMAATEHSGGGWRHHQHFSLELVYYAQLTRLLMDGWAIIATLCFFIVLIGRLNPGKFLRKKELVLFFFFVRGPPITSVEENN